MKRTPTENAASARKITRRALFLGGSQVAFMGALGLRMRYLQVDQADTFRLLAEENRIRDFLLAPARGLIYDRNGALLAENEQTLRVVIRKEDAAELDAVLIKLQELIGITAEDQARVRDELKKAGPSAPVIIADRLSWEDFSLVSANGPALPGVTPEVGLSRYYPLHSDFAHLVGYVGPVSSYDISRMETVDPVYKIPKFQLGKFGIEAKLEDTLKGKAGLRRVEQNAYGRILRELDRQEGQNGANIQLTLDHRLQNFVQARLVQDLSASAVVLDLESGDILAAGSVPSFDANLFVRGISSKNYNALLEDKYRPLPGKSIQGLFPPGSTFKMVTALAALEAGVIDIEENVRCLGHVEVGGRRFHCWKRAGHGNVNLIGSLRHSCDCYYYEIAQRVGIEKIAEMGQKLGLGQAYGLPLTGELAGLVPNKAWKLANRGAEWVVGDSLNASIGQGFVLSSPMHLATMCARLATGHHITPRLVHSIDGMKQPSGRGAPLDVNENMLRTVRQGMFEATNSTRGTAHSYRIADETMRIAGKTGTSQSHSTVVNNKEVEWERRDHGLFVGYAPFDDPKYAVATIVEHGGGAAVAASLARDVMLFALHGDIPPLSAYPAAHRGAAAERLKNLDLRETDQEEKRSRA